MCCLVLAFSLGACTNTGTRNSAADNTDQNENGVVREAGRTAGDMVDNAGNMVSDVTRKAGETAGNIVDDAGQAVNHAADGASDIINRTADGVGDLVDDSTSKRSNRTSSTTTEENRVIGGSYTDSTDTADDYPYVNDVTAGRYNKTDYRGSDSNNMNNDYYKTNPAGRTTEYR